MSKPKVTRRSFLQTVVVSAGAATLGPGVLGACGSSRLRSEVFPQSIASGDPRGDSIVLWTRALPEDPAADGDVNLELATDPEFGSRIDLGDLSSIVARADHDHCVRVKVTGLTTGTTYFYRFEQGGTVTNTGRFRTAELDNANVPVRFAVVSCQDRSGRYYNTLLRLLDGNHDDLTFVLHLGDYVYETDADPAFMTGVGERSVAFRNPEEAIPLGDGSFHAAHSVGNYRDLYRAFRSDPILQQVHERFPFIHSWDDHEFSDDCFGDNATYTDGQAVETDRERRINSEQAYFEYMPIATDVDGNGSLSVDRGALFPNTRLYRSFRFGRHCTLAITDYRSFRPDHMVPEDAFPGAVILDEAQTRAGLARQEADGDLPDDVTALMAFADGGFRSYVDLEDGAFADHKRALSLLLTAAYEAEGVEPAHAAELAARYAQGLTDAAILEDTIDAGRSALPADLTGVAAVDPTDPTLPLGLPYAMLGKTSLVGQLGARYLIVQRTFDLVAAWRSRVNMETEFDHAFGAEQESWLAGVLSGSDATWNIVGNSVNNTSLILDLSPFAGGLPEGLPAERFYLNGDHWDGFPERRRRLIRDIYNPANAILVAGDIHAAFATDLGDDGAGNRTLELTTAAVSSETWKGLLLRTGNRSEAIRESGLLEPLTEGIDGLQMLANPNLRLARSNHHGVLIVQLDEIELVATWHLLAAPIVEQSYYDNPEALSDQWERETFRVAKLSGNQNGLLARI